MSLFNKWRKKAPGAEPGVPVGGPLAEDSSDPGESDAGNIGRNRTILVVDDDLTVLKAFEMKFEALGFRVLTAVDGSAAMALVHQETPDLIILDMIFPPDDYSYGLQWDGITIMQWLQRFKQSAGIPIIVISVESPEKFEAKALAGGALAYFQKPINVERFLLTIRRTLGNPAKTN